MILCAISDLHRYKGISPKLDEALYWLQAHSSDTFQKGKIAVGADEDIIVNCEEPHLRTAESAELEAHRCFIDIHVPLKSRETIGWAPVSVMKYPHGEYDAERDICFFGDSATSILQVRVGQIVIFFPEDAHAPNIGTGTHRKLCIKIPV